MAPWLRVLEAYMVQLLLRTPAFHRGVEKIARGVNRIRHGTPPEDLGGTKIDQPANGTFFRHFSEEIQTQLGRAEGKTGEAALKNETSVATKGKRAEWTKEADEEGAEAAWQGARDSAAEEPKRGFMGEYADALREQIRGGKGR